MGIHLSASDQFEQVARVQKQYIGENMYMRIPTCGKSADLRIFLHNVSPVVYLCGKMYKIMLWDNSWAFN